MAQPRENIPTSAGEVVGARRGGPAHLIDGIGPGKGVITKASLSGTIVPEAVSTVPAESPIGYEPK